MFHFKAIAEVNLVLLDGAQLMALPGKGQCQFPYRAHIFPSATSLAQRDHCLRQEGSSTSMPIQCFSDTDEKGIVYIT